MFGSTPTTYHEWMACNQKGLSTFSKWPKNWNAWYEIFLTSCPSLRGHVQVKKFHTRRPNFLTIIENRSYGAIRILSGATLGGGDEHCHPLGPALVRDEHFEPSEINP